MFTRWPASAMLAVGALLGVASPSVGQTCLGRPSFRDGMFQVHARVNKVVGGTSSNRLGVLVGRGNILAGISHTWSEPGFFRRALNYQIGIDIERRVGVCPIFEISTIGGSDDADTFVTNGYSADFGIFLGAAVFENDHLKVIPAGGFRVYRYDLDFDLLRTSINPDQTLGSTSQLIQGGIGLVFSRQFGVTATVTRNLSESDANPVLVIAASVQF
jgi:hypothetical protein